MSGRKVSSLRAGHIAIGAVLLLAVIALVLSVLNGSVFGGSEPLFVVAMILALGVLFLLGVRGGDVLPASTVAEATSQRGGNTWSRTVAWLAILVAVAGLAVVVASEPSIEDAGPPLAVFGLLFVLGVALLQRAKVANGSLQRQLVTVGLIVVLLPMLVVVLTFTESSSELVVEDEVLVVEDGTSFAPDAALAAVLLAAGAMFAVWSWSARAVKPMAAITEVANDIQDGSLDRRIGLSGAHHEVQALADSFDLMLDRLATASKSQQQLIEDASHELRTPLAALAINNEVMLSNETPTIEDYRASTERNEALVKRLQSTLDELLAGARTRTAEMRQVDNDMMAIIDRVVVQHRILNPGVVVVVRGPEELRLGIDGPSVERALANLVENAARYSPPGVPIAIDVVPQSRTTVSVSDYGPGIADDELDNVFNRYHQNDEVGQAGESGIGLALVKQVADAHGGIEVVSPLPGGTKGTRFTLFFDTPAYFGTS